MPSTITHAYFGLDLYDRLDDKTKDRLKNNLEHLKTYAQGPDFFYFYNLFCINNGQDIRSFGKYMHHNKTKAFFVNLIKYIKEQKLEKNNEVISFLYGFIAHYILDSNTHPFIIYKTGVYEKKEKDTHKYFGLHNDMESYIDAYFIFHREHVKPKYFKPYNFCFNVHKMSSILMQTIDYTFKETFGKEDIGDIYLRCIKQAKCFYKTFRYDPLGIKKEGYKLIDYIFPYTTVKKEGISYYIDPKKKIHYLNLEKKEWHYPTNNNEVYNYSFIELYIIALHRASKMIKEVNKVLYEKKSIKHLDTIFLNLSYATNKDCNLKLKSKYFEF